MISALLQWPLPASRFVLVLAATCLVACAPAVQNITVKSPAPSAAAPDVATLVIVQPTTRFGSLTLLDGRGAVVGQLHDRSRTVIPLPAGPFRLYGVVEKQYAWADRIEGTVEAGRTYYATVSLRYGGIALRALNPRSPDNRWSQKDQYVANTPHVQMDPQKVRLVKAELGDPKQVLQAGDAYVAKLDAAHRAERTVLAEDGI